LSPGMPKVATIAAPRAPVAPTYVPDQTVEKTPEGSAAV
jgi:hypothetical protein